VQDRVESLFVIFDIRALDVSCTHMATVGIKGVECALPPYHLSPILFGII